MDLMDALGEDKIGDGMVLCASSAYEKKYYLSKNFSTLPQQIKDELQIMCVLYTEEIGGIFTLVFDTAGNLTLNVTSTENDPFFDEIGSVLKIKQMQKQKAEFLESLEKYYKVKFLGEEI